jgi:hypothetical protein
MHKIDLKKAHQIYKKDGKAVPGASTIASYAGAYESQRPLMIWACREGLKGNDITAVSDEAMKVGTVSHFLTDRWIDKQEYDLSNIAPTVVSQAETAAVKFGDWWDKGGYTSVSNEEQMVSKQWKYGGTLDNVIRDRDGKLWLIDKKTSNGIYSSAWYQLGGLFALWQDNHPDLPLAGTGVVRIGKEEDMADFEVQWKTAAEIPPYWRVFLCGLELYWAVKDIKGAKR